MQLSADSLQTIIRRQHLNLKNIQSFKNDNQRLHKQLEQIKRKCKKYSISYAIFIFSRDLFSYLAQVQIKNGTVIQKDVGHIVAFCESFNERFFQMDREKNKKVIAEVKSSKQFQNYKKQGRQLLLDPKYQQDQLTIFLGQIFKTDSKQNILANQTSFKLKKPQKNDIQLRAFHEYSTNYLRSFLQNRKKTNKQKLICCKPIFFNKQQIQTSQGPCQQFKRYTWPINNVSIKTHVTKTIIGFLNSKGGIIFIGIMQTKQKKNEVTGIWLSVTEIKQIRQFIAQIVSNINPKHYQFQNPQNQNFQTVKQQYILQYQLNKYIKMQFMPVVNQQTYTNAHSFKNDGIINQSLYIVKIIVKMGHPKHLYHVVNTEKNIDFYQRTDRNVEKKPFPEAYKQIYARLDKFQKAKKSGFAGKEIDRPSFHPNCRYVMTDIQLLLQEDKDSSSSDDDDDS